jgi:aldehyde dehydrogenase (NAD+)
MSQLSIELTAPNGRTWSQPIGLFINNEFVESQKGNKLVTIDPAYVHVMIQETAWHCYG